MVCQTCQRVLLGRAPLLYEPLQRLEELHSDEGEVSPGIDEELRSVHDGSERGGDDAGTNEKIAQYDGNEASRHLEKEPEPTHSGHRAQIENKYFKHHLTAESLLAAVDGNCRICCQLWEGMTPETKKKLQESVDGPDDDRDAKLGYVTTAYLWKQTSEVWSLDVYSSDGDIGTADFYIVDSSSDQQTLRETTFPKHEVPYHHDAFNSVLFSHRIRLIEEWIHKCKSSHSKCKDDGSRDGWNPTRLLDLSKASEGTTHLVICTDFVDEVDYMTLSHCWGKGQFLKLTTATEARLKAGIDLSELPPNFRDAVHVTHALGQRYLWIDSLCILQRQEHTSECACESCLLHRADWKHESSFMHQVYGHSVCNISAAGDHSGPQGLNLHHSSLEEIDFLADNGSTERRILVDWRFSSRNVVDAEVNKRGWVLQERLLTKRVIHFGQDQMCWECCELDAAEGFPDGVPAAGKYSAEFKSVFNHIDVAAATEPGPVEHPGIWWRIVATYSKCKLTNPEDKLVAIAGVARQMERFLQDEYVAGMWRRTLAYDLFWSTFDHRESHRPVGYRAPSWSWASVDGAVDTSPSGAPDSLRFRIKHVSLTHITSDTMGLIKAGYILLEGVIKPVEITLDHDSASGDDFVFTVGGNQIKIDEYSLSLDSVEDRHDIEHGDQKARWYLMEGYVGFLDLFMLLLLRCEDVKAGTFSRVGILRHYYKEQGKEALLARDPAESSYPCISWNEETRTHTIRVI